MLDFHKIRSSGDNPEGGEQTNQKKPIVDIVVDSIIVAGMVGVSVIDPAIPLDVQAITVVKTFLVALFGQLIYERKIKKVE